MIVEDHGFVAEATKQQNLISEPQAEVVITETAEAALGAIKGALNSWWLILLDLDFPGARGLSLAIQIKELGLSHITCVVTGSENEFLPGQLKGKSFLGFTPKAAHTSAVKSALAMVLAHEAIFIAEDDGSTKSSPQLTRGRLKCCSTWL